MKFLHIIPALLAFCSLTACANYETTDTDILESFRNEPNAEFVHVPKFLLKIGTTFARVNADDTDERQALKLASKINSVKVLDLDDCSQNVKARFTEEMENLEDKGYESLIRINDDGENVRIFLRRNKDCITELLILDSSDDDLSMVQLKGKIKESEIGRLINSEFD